MPNKMEYKFLTAEETVSALGKLKRYNVSYPKKNLSKTELQQKLATWRKSQDPLKPVSPKLAAIKGIRLKSDHVSKFRSVIESHSPTAEAIGQKMGPDDILGTMYSSLAALEFTKMQGELKQRLSGATTAGAKENVNAAWAKIVDAGKLAYSAAGVGSVSAADLGAMAKELQSNKNNFNAIASIASTAAAAESTAAKTMAASFKPLGGFVAVSAVIPDPGGISKAIADICSKPFVEGSFSKDFSHAFNLTVTMTVWCPTWTNPFRTCKKTFVLAGVSFSFKIDVGYKVTCCGATAWGQAVAEACGTLIGIKVCASCSGSITGVAGVGRSGSGNSCTYGLGINAQLKCTFAGITVFQAQAPFGFNVSGPCPPLGLCA
ncbi:MAG TPA: hypothetical protein VL728_18100 [Cyclobacteriaceae bacterium]|jgi:hypothetical protein|nr:hypothetical protein [Cyclobacteriaceae bacterium]